jgi:N-acyl-phosphatidylethanolamine-hydrolysing phospholipase D
MLPMRRCLLALPALLACALVRPLPPAAPAVQGLPLDDEGATFSAVWVGHATVLLRFGHRTVLTDPNLRGALLGIVPRHTPASLRAGELPRIDVALLSHMHFDHFDAPTLRKLGRRTAVFFPADGAAYSDEIVQRHKQGLVPWQEVRLNGLTLTAVPARHQGGRYGIDFLWNHACTGYVIEGAGHRVFFAGDTGYDPAIFKEIGRRFPGIEVAFIPIAPGKGDAGTPDRWGHVGPRGALDILADLGARYMVPIHHEAFFSSGQRMGDARVALAAEVRRRGLEDRVFALRTGQGLALREGQAAVLSERPGEKLAAARK